MRAKKGIRIVLMLAIVVLSVYVFFFGSASTTASAKGILRGDVNKDGTRNMDDVRLVINHVYGTKQLTIEQRQIADLDGDKRITRNDALLLLRLARQTKKDADEQTAEDPQDLDRTVRAVWISTAAGDFPSKPGLSAGALKEEIDGILQSVSSLGLNTIYLQVRAYSDALYPSEIYPCSRFLCGKEGTSPGFDVLEYFIDRAHERGILLYAWVNPYRVSSTSHATTRLAASNPACLYPERTVLHRAKDGSEAGIWYDPGLPEVRQMICDSVEEILERYDVDGIHFDDYFYPYENAEGFADDASYGRYGNGQSRATWRRENVNTLLREVQRTIRDTKPEVRFSVSPFGVWAKQSEQNPDGTPGLGWVLEAYEETYADARAWVQNGWVDEICPQLYWEFDHPSAPFAPLADWWNDLCAGTDVTLTVGLGAYREEFAQSEIARQLEYLQAKENVDGVAFFRYGSLKEDVNGVNALLRRIGKPLQEAPQRAEDAAALGKKWVIQSSRCDMMLRTGNSDRYGPVDHALGVNGMAVAVEEWGDGSARLTNGFYVNTKDLCATNETLYAASVGTVTMRESPEYTLLFLPCSERMATAIRLEESYSDILLMGLDDPHLTVADLRTEKKLFSAAEVLVQGEDSVILRLHYKRANHIFGYEASFTESGLSIRYKNPMPARDGALPLKGREISLDPGHSNTDGCSGYYEGVKIREWELNLDLAHRVQNRLEELGATVTLTHNGERKIGLQNDIIPAIRKERPDINVSIHFNWVEKKSANGTAVWWCFRNSALLAQELNAAVAETADLFAMGAKNGHYMVSRFCEFPSVLLETLYVSNKDEFAWYMSSEENRERVADGVANGILAYFEAQR